MSEDYSNQTILTTYKSIIHISGDKKLYDGTGSLVVISSASVAISASFAEDCNYALSAGYALTSPYTADSASINNKINDKQDVLVSGTNIKTINGQSVVGSGNITTYVSASGQNVIFGDILADTLIANEYITISSSVVYSSGSTKFGDSSDDNHDFTGSVFITGSLVVNGNIILPVPSGIISSSNQVSYVDLSNIPSGIISSSTQFPSGIISSSNQITSISHAETSSYLNNNQGFILSSQTSSIIVASSSYAETSSYSPNYVLLTKYGIDSSSINNILDGLINNNQTSSMSVLSASYSNTASYLNNNQGFVLNSQTSSMSVLSSSYSNTSSYSDTSSYLINGQGFVLSNQTSSMSVLSSSYSNTSSYSDTSSYLNNNQGFVLNSQTSSMSVLSASYSSTSSYVILAQTASYLNNNQGFVLSNQTSSMSVLSASYSNTSSWTSNLFGFDLYSSSISSSLNTKIGDSYETVSKNLKDYPKTLVYSGTTLLHVTHSLSDGSQIYKVFIYSGSYIITSSLSGNLPSNIKTNKILSYNSSGSVIGITYT
jgi:hypothetical protein